MTQHEMVAVEELVLEIARALVDEPDAVEVQSVARDENTVLKLKVATNTPDWETRLRIIGASTEEIIADKEFGGGLPHWQLLENVGIAISMSKEKIRSAKPLKSTQLAWNAWKKESAPPRNVRVDSALP